MASSVSGTELTSRQKCLDDLDDYISNCHKDISAMLDQLGWTPDHFVEPKTRSKCPYNSGHKMPSNSLPEHTRVCELVSKGCSKEEAEKILVDTKFAYQGSSCVFTEVIDLEKMNAVLWNFHRKNNSVFYGYKDMPLTPEQEEQMLSREDRLGLADFIVNKAREAKKLKELGRDELLVSENLADLVSREDEKRQLDHVEELAAMRDYKRRRQTYRAKNVHITKKSHTEILREVITNQMDMYAKSLTDQGSEEQTADRERHEESRSQNRRDRPEDRSSNRDRTGESRSRYGRLSDERSESRNRREQLSRHGRDKDSGSGSRDRIEGSRSRHEREREDRSRSRDRKEDSRSRYGKETDDRSGSRETREDSRSRYDKETEDRSDSRDRREGSNKQLKETDAKTESQDRKERHRSPGKRKRSRSRDREKRKRSRSRSGSSSRHKKSKHKKHKKHKRKHKHRGSDLEEGETRDKDSNSEDATDDV